MDQPQVQKVSPEELERLGKSFLDGLESLRTEEREVSTRFGIEVAAKPLVDTSAENFSFKENLKLFESELTKTEEALQNSRGGQYADVDINQALSMMRIIREKARTLLSRLPENQIEDLNI